MTRLRALLALALLPLTAALPASAAPPAGEIVVVADGTASGLLTLPDGADLSLSADAIDTAGRYAVVGFVHDGALVAGADRYGTLDPGFPLVLPGHVPPGTTSVRVVAESPVVVTIPAAGIRGRVTIRLTDPLPGAVGEVRTPVPTGPVVRSDIPVTLVPDAVTVHVAYDAASPVPHAQAFCVSALPCADGAGAGSWDGETRTYWPWDGLSGDVTAQLTYAASSAPRLTHLVVSLPLG